MGIAAVAGFLLLSFNVSVAQDKPRSVAAAQDCEPGFERRDYPHGSPVNFRCRTRVIDCPGRQGYHVAVIQDPSFETAQGVQFGYRCEYLSRER